MPPALECPEPDIWHDSDNNRVLCVHSTQLQHVDSVRELCFYTFRENMWPRIRSKCLLPRRRLKIGVALTVSFVLHWTLYLHAAAADTEVLHQMKRGTGSPDTQSWVHRAQCSMFDDHCSGEWRFSSSPSHVLCCGYSLFSNVRSKARKHSPPARTL